MNQNLNKILSMKWYSPLSTLSYTSISWILYIYWRTAMSIKTLFDNIMTLVHMPVTLLMDMQYSNSFRTLTMHWLGLSWIQTNITGLIFAPKLSRNRVNNFDSFEMHCTHHYGHWEKTSYFRRMIIVITHSKDQYITRNSSTKIISVVISKWLLIFLVKYTDLCILIANIQMFSGSNGRM